MTMKMRGESILKTTMLMMISDRKKAMVTTMKMVVTMTLPIMI